jgi:CHAT domain
VLCRPELACESWTSGQTDRFSGAAAGLVRGGVSAVTAMQFVISDRAAIAFSRGSYTAIGRGRSIDEAVRSGRVAIVVGLGADSLEWITPTLFLRGQETHLFALSESLGQSVPEPIQAEQRSVRSREVQVKPGLI